MRLDDASLLIDGDASKTFKIVQRNCRKEVGTKKEGEHAGMGELNIGRRDREPRIAFTYENGGSIRQKERVSLSSASSHTSRQGYHEMVESLLIFVGSLLRNAPLVDPSGRMDNGDAIRSLDNFKLMPFGLLI